MQIAKKNVVLPIWYHATHPTSVYMKLMKQAIIYVGKYLVARGSL